VLGSGMWVMSSMKTPEGPPPAALSVTVKVSVAVWPLARSPPLPCRAHLGARSSRIFRKDSLARSTSRSSSRSDRAMWNPGAHLPPL